jgi:hypothetical protein
VLKGTDEEALKSGKLTEKLDILRDIPGGLGAKYGRKPV